MANDSKTWRCGKYELSFDRPRIMGVLNVTPDSFSDGGEHFDPDAAIEYGLAMLDAGADIIDVGGESTRPGFTPVNPDEEARRVLPVVRALAKEGAIVSIDTRHVAVAKAAVRCGASIVNDVTGFTDPKMVEFVKTSTCGVIVMHAGEVAAPTRTHATVQLDTSAAAFVAEKAREAAAEAAREAEKPARRRRGKLLGEPKVEAKLPGGVVQPSLPFGEPEPTSEPATELGQETPAAEQVAAAETVAPAPEAAPAATEVASESNDHLAAMMRRSARREEAYVPTSQLRRFTLPDSAPIMRRVMGFLSDQARTLIHAGVSRDRICIDPGPGFGKSANEDIVIQRETAKMASLGYPLMCAVSRKRFVGAVSGVTEAAARDAATFGVCLGAIQAGANIVRVHDAAGFAQFLNGYWAVAKPQPRRAFVAAMGMMDALVGTASTPGLGLAGKVGIQWPSDIVCGAPAFETSLARVAVNGGAGAAGMFAAVTVDVERAALGELGVDMADEALIEALAAAVLVRVDTWAVAANTPQGAAGPLAPVLGEYFDMVPLLGRQVAAVSPSGLPLAVGVFAGLDIWGRATIKTDAGEQEFPPEAVRIRGL